MNRAIALLSAVLAVPLLAQTHSESITVEVVDVPVYVYGANGPIRNLTKGDFELFVNGKRQEIDYFDAIDFTAAAPAAASGPAPEAAAPQPPRDLRERRLFLLIVDTAFSRPAALDRARKATAAMIEHAAPSDYFAIATFTSKHGVQLAVPFTNNHAVAMRAALALQPSSAHDPLALAMSSNEYAIVQAILDDDSPRAGGGGGGPEAKDPFSSGGFLTAEAENSLAPAKRLIEDQMNDFAAIAERLRPLQGYKRVVLFSEGFNPYLAYMNTRAIDPRLIDAMHGMATSFRSAGAVVDTIDLDPQRGGVMNDALHFIAAETGGQFITHENDVHAALNRIEANSAVGYRLGFRMPHDAKKGDNTIDVKVRDVPLGTRLSFRRGFSTVPASPSNADGLRLADVILNDVPQSGIAPRIAFPEKPYITVEVPARELLAVSNGLSVQADVLLYIFDAKGIVVEFKEKRFTIPGDAKGDAVVRDALKLPAGKYVAKALLRVGDSLGFARQEFALR
jgi:VWFA-related protein